MPPNLKTLANFFFQVSVRFHSRRPELLMTTIESSLLRVLVKETFTLVFISVDFYRAQPKAGTGHKTQTVSVVFSTLHC